MGDFNSKVGKRSEEESVKLGLYGYRKTNKQGENLIHFCQENNLKIVNSYYKKRASKRCAWLAPNGIHKNELDYILSPHLNLINTAGGQIIILI